MDTSTAPNTPQNTLDALMVLSQQLLACQQDDLEKIQLLLNQREPLVQELLAFEHSTIPVDNLATWQKLDEQVMAHFKAIHLAQTEELKKMSQGKQALASYQFPVTNPQPGIESQG